MGTWKGTGTDGDRSLLAQGERYPLPSRSFTYDYHPGCIAPTMSGQRRIQSRDELTYSVVSRSEGRHLMSVTSILKEEMLDLLRNLKIC